LDLNIKTRRKEGKQKKETTTMTPTTTQRLSQVYPHPQEYSLHLVRDVTKNVGQDEWASERSKVEQTMMDDGFEAERCTGRRRGQFLKKRFNDVVTNK
jgi:hypothetical protein